MEYIHTGITEIKESGNSMKLFKHLNEYVLEKLLINKNYKQILDDSEIALGIVKKYINLNQVQVYNSNNKPRGTEHMTYGEIVYNDVASMFIHLLSSEESEIQNKCSKFDELDTMYRLQLVDMKTNGLLKIVSRIGSNIKNAWGDNSDSKLFTENINVFSSERFIILLSSKRDKNGDMYGWAFIGFNEKDMDDAKEYVKEQLSDVKTSWHPKKGIFTNDDPKEIVDYLMKNSKDQAQAMQRLCFYMNRAGDNLSNKTVLNKAKQLLKKEKVNEKLVINKNYKSPDDNRCLLIYSLVWDKNNSINIYNNIDQVTLAVGIDCKVKNDNIIINSSSKNAQAVPLKRIDNYYYWETESKIFSIYLVGLDYNEAMNFLNEIYKNIPEKINIHDYFSASPSHECEFKFYDGKTQTYKQYTKRDIDKFIKELNK